MSWEERAERSMWWWGGEGGVAWRTKAALCHSLPARRHFQRHAAISSLEDKNDYVTKIINLLLALEKGWKI